MSTVKHRHDFVFLFDCQDGNPNGDPDADNAPRFDQETYQGLVSDVCLKRKVRDYVFQSQRDGDQVQRGYRIFIQSGSSLESRQREPYDDLKDEIKPGKDAKTSDIQRARAWMCEHFFDVRAFGAVMSTTNFNCGQVRGPVQVTFARSIDRIFSTEHAISRQAFTTEKEKETKQGPGTLGRKHTIAYGLYKVHGFINPVFADQTGFSEDDLLLLWKSLENMFSIDRSASRGLMASRDLFVFRHHSRLGEAHAHKLFDLVNVKLKERVVTPRSYGDYVQPSVDPSKLPSGVELLTPFAVTAGA